VATTGVATTGAATSGAATTATDSATVASGGSAARARAICSGDTSASAASAPSSLSPPPANALNTVSGRIVDIGYLGDISVYKVRLDDGALLVGAWIECPPSTMSVYTPALWFATSGTWNRLLFDGSGGLVVGYGVTNQGTYSFPRIDSDPVSGNNYTTVAAASMNFAPSDYSSGPMTLETSPARLHTIITYLDETIGVWLVRLP